MCNLFFRDTESEKSYSLSEKESKFQDLKASKLSFRRGRNLKIKKRESFKERLNASLARGETPDIESGSYYKFITIIILII